MSGLKKDIYVADLENEKLVKIIENFGITGKIEPGDRIRLGVEKNGVVEDSIFIDVLQVTGERILGAVKDGDILE